MSLVRLASQRLDMSFVRSRIGANPAFRLATPKATAAAGQALAPPWDPQRLGRRKKGKPRCSPIQRTRRWRRLPRHGRGRDSLVPRGQ